MNPAKARFTCLLLRKISAVCLGLMVGFIPYSLFMWWFYIQTGELTPWRIFTMVASDILKVSTITLSIRALSTSFLLDQYRGFRTAPRHAAARNQHHS